MIRCELCNTKGDKVKYVGKLPNGSTVNTYYCHQCWMIIFFPFNK